MEFGEDTYGLFQVFEFGSIKHAFRWCPPGEFWMGSPDKEKGRYDNEILHKVKLTQGFWLGETTVTQALWEQIMGDNPSHFLAPENPVDSVSWNDCHAFIERLNGSFPEMKAIHPAEAQWEYACRAGTQTAFSFGDEISLEQANYSGQWNDYETNGKSCSVYSYAANPWGFFQMHGNTWEWCRDWYGDLNSTPQVDPAGPDDGAARVVRGGSWFYPGSKLRSACRNRYHPDNRDHYVGLRLALDN